LTLFASLYFLIELVDRLDNFLDWGASWGDAALYMLLRLPGMVHLMVPMACLAASVLTFSALSRHNEILAMRAAGVAPLRLAGSLCLLGGVACVLLLLAQEYLLPVANQSYRAMWRTRMRRTPDASSFGRLQHGPLWYRGPNRFWQVQRSFPLDNRLVGVTIFVLDTAGDIRQRYDATEALWEEKAWTLHRGTLRRFDAAGGFAGPPEHFVRRRVDFSESPAVISAVPKQLDEMGMRELLIHARQLRRRDLPVTHHMVEWHSRIAFAAVSILMAGLGVPLALRSNRVGGAARAVAITLVGGLSYWVLHTIALACGHSGQCPPLLAAWSGNIALSCSGVYLAWRTR
jgi:lipopolysaccharide export system permease protein